MKMNRQENERTCHQGCFFFVFIIISLISLVEPSVSLGIFSDQMETGSDVLEPRKRYRGSPMSQV